MIRGQGSSSRFFKQFLSDTAGYSKSRFEPNVRKNASNKITFQIFAFLIIAAELDTRPSETDKAELDGTFVLAVGYMKSFNFTGQTADEIFFIAFYIQ